MSISLAKGAGISLAKKGGGSLTQIRLGVGWDAAKPKSAGGGFMSRMFGGGSGGTPRSIDLDASCVMFDANDVQRDEVWYGKLVSNCKKVRHSGDNRTGDGAGDDETIFVDLSLLPHEIDTLVFTVQSFQGQTFNEVDNAYARLVDDTKNEEVARYTISEAGDHNGVIMAKVSRRTGEWRIDAIGAPVNGRSIHDIASDIRAVL